VKPWEEEWTADGARIDFSKSHYGSACFEPDRDDKGREESLTRAKLAAQAPAMARLLMQHEWEYSEEFQDAICRFCVRGAPGEAEGVERTGHTSDCPRQNVLRAAGVLP
jgi:hypothetical protein